MTLGANALIGLLGGVGRAIAGRQTPQQSIGTSSFEELLAQARAGEFSSGLPVSIAPDASVKLNPDQLTRLVQAADQAEAEGANRAIVLMDGMALTLDVATRTVTGKADASATRVLAGYDAVVAVAAAPKGIPLGAVTGPTGLNYANPSLLAALAPRAD